VDHDEDPYCITKGLFYAHMGWLMFKLKPLPPFDNVADLRKDPLVAWQHRYIHLIAVLVAFVLQASIGFAWGGWKAALYLFSAAKGPDQIGVKISFKDVGVTALS